jgi:hypothetical protein
MEMTIEGKMKEKASNWANQYVLAIRDKDEGRKRAVLDEVNAWNKKQFARGTPQFTVDLSSAISYRMRPEVHPKKLRGTFKKMEEEWMR